MSDVTEPADQPVYPPNASGQCGIAVVLVAHGDQGDSARTQALDRNRALAKHSDALSASNTFRRVACGVLKGSPTLESALDAVRATQSDAVVVYPFFMSDGYFVKTVLAQRLKDYALGRPVLVCPPLGLDPKLPDLVWRQALEVAKDANIQAQSARLLIVGHGSKFGPASANTTRSVAEAVKTNPQCRFADIDVAFLEEAPFLSEQLAIDAGPTIVSGFFNGDGLHAGEDVPNAIAAANNGAIYAGPIGDADGVARLIHDTILSTSRSTS